MGVSEHDGKLPAGSELSTDGEVRWDRSFLAIQAGRNTVVLDGYQALRLLAWLEEEWVKIAPLARELKGRE